jgi:hypothetical protein
VSDKIQVNFVQDEFWDPPLNSQKIPNGLHSDTLDNMKYLVSKEIPIQQPTGFKGSALQTDDLWKVFDLDESKKRIIYPATWNGSFFNPDVAVNKKFEFKFHYSDDIIDEKNLFYVVELLGGFSNSFKFHQYINRGILANAPLEDVFDKGTLFTNISLKSLELIRNGNMLLVLSYMHEGTIHQQDFKALHEALVENKIPPDSVVVIAGSLNFIFRYDKWCKKNFIKEKVKTLESRHYIEDTSRAWSKKSIKYKEVLKRESIIRKNYFLSYNGVVDCHKVHRAIMLASFVHNDLFNKGLISCLTHNLFGDRSVKTIIERMEFHFDDSDLVEKFKTSFDKLQDIIPIYLDFKYDYSDPKDNRKNSSLLGNDNFRDSYFSVVTESIPEGESICVTEKILKPLINLHPFIILAPPNYLQKLRELGFKTFHPFIDESYDKIENPLERYICASEEVKRLCSLPIEEIHEWYYSILKPVLLHNKEVHLSYGLKSERVDFINFLLEN